MEYVLNWMVLLLTLGALALVALVCYADLRRPNAPVAEASVQAVEIPDQPQIQQQQTISGPYIELIYRQGEDTEYVQRVGDGSKGYIGTESYPKLGSGMPVRYIEIAGQGGKFTASNLDWQMPVVVRGEDTGEFEASMGQVVELSDGAELALPEGWTIECRIVKEDE
jgi:hypothetical protein